MTERKAVCYHCKKPIENKDELVTAHKYFSWFIKPYHTHCYAELGKMKTPTSVFVSDRPVNSLSTTLLTIVKSVIGVFIVVMFLFLLLTNQEAKDFLIIMVVLSIVAFVYLIVEPIFIRLFSYYKYEKKYD